METGYFDITHSFKIDSATYHVLGLRKDRPTYGNNYYIFNCSCDRSQSARLSLPPINSHWCHDYQKTEKKVRSSPANVPPSKPTTATTTPTAINNNNLTEIKQYMVDLMKKEREQLIASFREDFHSERTTLIKSFEKDSEVVNNVKTIVKNDKEELIRSIEKQRSILESTFERHVNNLNSSIELLKKTLTQSFKSQQEQFQSLERFYTDLNENIQQQIEQTIVKQYESQRTTTTIDRTSLKEIQATLIDVVRSHSTTDNDDDSLKRLFNDQKQHLTDLIMKQQRTYSTTIDEIKQLQKDLLNTMKEISSSNKQHEQTSLDVLFEQQTETLKELIIHQQDSSSTEFFEQTMRQILKEHFSTSNSSGMIRTPRPFKFSIVSGEYAQAFARLYIDGNEYPKEMHTLCQRDPHVENVIDCFVSPPSRDGPCEVIIYAKTAHET
ncbi:unnamed protein product, partial [Adineta ricciae]